MTANAVSSSGPLQPRSAEHHRRRPANLESHWKQLCTRGNDAFLQGRNQAAERDYREALALGHVAIDLAHGAADSVPEERLENWLSIWVISHLNLSDLHIRAAQPERAIEVAFAAYERIVECLHDTRVATRVHRACLRHLRHVLDGMKDLMCRSGMADAASERIVAKAQALALGYWNAWT